MSDLKNATNAALSFSSSPSGLIRPDHETTSGSVLGGQVTGIGRVLRASTIVGIAYYLEQVLGGMPAADRRLLELLFPECREGEAKRLQREHGVTVTVSCPQQQILQQVFEVFDCECIL